MDADKIDKASDHESPVVITVFIAEPLTERPITDLRPDDTPEEVEARQEYLDTISGYEKPPTEPFGARFLVDRCDDDTDIDLARRQKIVDAITGWRGKK